ncbi:MAG: S8 family peptidase [Phycisphaerales bacterium]
MQVRPGTVAAAIAAYRADPAVRYAEPDARVFSTQTTIPNDPSFGLLWGLHNTGQTGGKPDADIDAPEAWNTWTGDPGFRVAVLDTGISYSHPDLASNIWTNPGEVVNGVDDDGNGYVDDIHGIDTANDDSDPSDDDSHGTHCAGIVGAVGNNGLGVVGVNWACKLVALKFETPTSVCPWTSGLISACVEAMEYVIDQGIKVSSNSYRCYGAFPQALYDVIEASQSIGHIFVAAAGNENQNNDVNPPWPAAFDLPNIITVAAIDASDKLASFSNYGPSTVDLGAPGVVIYSTTLNGGFGYKSGTSMACPHVAGVIALVWSRFPALSWQEVRDQVLDNVRPVPALTGITVTGGVVNAKSALDAGCMAIPSDIWVDFAFGGFECGAPSNPFNTLAEGASAVSSGGTISIKAGSAPEAITINKSVLIKAVGGTVTIGQ